MPQLGHDPAQAAALPAPHLVVGMAPRLAAHATPVVRAHSGHGVSLFRLHCVDLI
ncbi:MAG TPA: hypothetical protein VK824_08585 [Planctomycetota bacterium]|nr:hypothetical protein [Planctomycetota bacterium]